MESTDAGKTAVISKYRRNETDTGSPEVQVALLTQRIEGLSGHFDKHQKDFSSRRGLLRMVGRRKRLLRYLMETDRERYNGLIQSLGLRK